jgi:hypothetical protein
VVEDVMLRYSGEVGIALPALQEDLVKAARRARVANHKRTASS